MVLKVMFIVFIFNNVNCEEIAIQTEGTGPIYSTITPDIATYYTKLSNYLIFPNDEQSLRFRLKACSYSYVLLSASFFFDKATDIEFYEIVIGGSQNRIDKIRRRYINGNDVELAEKSIRSLDCNEYRNFFINWTTNGNIQVGRDSGVFLETTDSNPIKILGLGIRTGFSQDGIWLFERTRVDIESKVEVSITFENMCQFMVNINWNCGEAVVKYSSLEYGEIYQPLTYVTHVWSATDAVTGIKQLLNGVPLFKVQNKHANGTVIIITITEANKVTGSTAIMVSLPTVTMVSGSRCLCPCDSKSDVGAKWNTANLTREEMLKIVTPKIAAIKNELQIDKFNLSMSRRRRTSAPDNRKSAEQIGIVGIVFLSFVLGLIVFIDFTTFHNGCR